MESKRKVSNKDLKQLLEFIQEAEKSEKSKSEKEPESAKKPEGVKKLENPKQEKNSEQVVFKIPSFGCVIHSNLHLSIITFKRGGAC